MAAECRLIRPGDARLVDVAGAGAYTAASHTVNEIRRRVIDRHGARRSNCSLSKAGESVHAPSPRRGESRECLADLASIAGGENERLPTGTAVASTPST